jgi:hypothetical protein
LAGADAGGVLLMLRCVPTEREAPTLAASASVAMKAAHSSATANPTQSFLMTIT